MFQNRIGNWWTILIWVVVVSLLLTACGGATPKTYTVGVLNVGAALDGVVEGFKQGLTELGYVEGENVTYIYELPAGMDQLDGVAQGLVEADVDLILSITTPATQAAQRATAGTDIPVVFVPVTDPVGAGIVDSLKNPGGNITGITFGTAEGRRLEWLIQVAPTIEQVYIPYNPDDQSAALALETVREAASAIGVELITHEVSSTEEVLAAIESVPEEADAIFILPDSMVGDHAPEFAKRGLPTSTASPEQLESYAVLTSYGMTMASAGKQAARLADQIFQGTKPANLPIETAEFYSAVNLKVAKALGLDIPDEILRQADIIVR